MNFERIAALLRELADELDGGSANDNTPRPAKSAPKAKRPRIVSPRPKNADNITPLARERARAILDGRR